MKTRRIYILKSLAQDEFMVFGTMKRAEEWIKHYNRNIFDKSTMSDLYIIKRVVF